MKRTIETTEWQVSIETDVVGIGNDRLTCHFSIEDARAVHAALGELLQHTEESQ